MRPRQVSGEEIALLSRHYTASMGQSLDLIDYIPLCNALDAAVWGGGRPPMPHLTMTQDERRSLDGSATIASVWLRDTAPRSSTCPYENVHQLEIENGREWRLGTRARGNKHRPWQDMDSSNSSTHVHIW